MTRRWPTIAVITLSGALPGLSACAQRDKPMIEPVVGHTYPVTTPSESRDDNFDVYATEDHEAPPPPPPPEVEGELLVDDLIVSNCALERGTRRVIYDGLDVHAGVELEALAQCLTDPTMSRTLITIIGYSDPPDGAGLRRADQLASALATRSIDASRMDTYAHVPAGAIADAVLVRLDE
jgi:hypothetical protein